MAVENEILGGLRNAVEKGESLDSAVKSFINAGYNPELVKIASQELTSGTISMTKSMPSNESSNSNIKKEEMNKEENKTSQLEGKSKKIVIGLIIGFIALIAVLLFLIMFGGSLF